MRNISITRLTTLAVAGAIVGFIFFLIINPSYVREETVGRHMFGADISEMLYKALTNAILVGALFSALLGGILVIADELTSSVKRVLSRMLIAVAIGAVLGAVASIFAQVIFSVFCFFGSVGLIIGRTVGWAVMGAGGGAGVGYAIGGWRRSWMATVGGFIGGGAGGMLFDVTATMTGGGSMSRFVGFVIMGAATGAAVALVEDIAKRSWITILSGPKEGKSFILTKPVTIIGRDELADIPLFGDPNVAKQHARLLLQGNLVNIESANGVAVTVNGMHSLSAQLTTGDLIGVGRFNMRFYQKAGAYTSAYAGVGVGQVPSRWSDPVAQQPSVSGMPQQVMMPPVAVPATGNLVLTVVGGPHMNQQFRSGPGTLRIGREAGYEILLAQDTKVSRNHAEIVWDGTQWIVRDLGSTNGLWVHGQRVPEYVLVPGDGFGVGQSVIRVDSI